MAISEREVQFNDNLKASSLGNDVIVFRNPDLPSARGENLVMFYMKNAEGKFQLASREAFQEYHKMLQAKGEKMPEEKPMEKIPLNEKKGNLYALTASDGTQLTVDFESRRELTMDERIDREFGGAPKNVAQPMTSIQHLADAVDRKQEATTEFQTAMNKAEMQHMADRIHASMEKTELEKNDRLEATSFGDNVIVLRDPTKPKEGGKNLEGFFIKNEEGNFQAATKETFQEYYKMLKDKGEQIPEEKMLSKRSLEKDLKGKVFEITDNSGKAVTLDFESKLELSSSERLLREAGFAPEKTAEPMTSIQHLADAVDRKQEATTEFRTAMNKAEMQHMDQSFKASMKKAELEKNDRLEATSFGDNVIVLRDPTKPKEGGKNLEGFFIKNENGKFQAATKETFQEYYKMLKDKGEQIPEEKMLSKRSLEKDLKGKVFEITDNAGKAVTLDFESKLELSSSERMLREAGFAPEKIAEPMTSIQHLADAVTRKQEATTEFQTAMNKAEMQHMDQSFKASMKKAELEKNDRLEATSFGDNVIVLRDPTKPKEGGKNLEGFFIKNEEGNFQAATKEAFHEYYKMLKDKGEQIPEEKMLSKRSLEKDLKGKVFEITDNSGKAVTLDFESKLELSSSERMLREAGFAPEKTAEPMTSAKHLADAVDRKQSIMKEFTAHMLQPAAKPTLMQQLSTQQGPAKTQPLMQQLKETSAQQQPAAPAAINRQVMDKVQTNGRR